jgi:hypothetical protein
MPSGNAVAIDSVLHADARLDTATSGELQGCTNPKVQACWLRAAGEVGLFCFIFADALELGNHRVFLHLRKVLPVM